jgi:hypothetical protein
MRKFIPCLLAIQIAMLGGCGRDPDHVPGDRPGIEQRRAEAARIRHNSSRGASALQPITITRSGDARVDAYRAMMETRRRAMHGVGPRTSDGEPAIRKSPAAR